MRNLVLLALLFSPLLQLTAQQDLTLYDLRSVPQSNQLNVSRTPFNSGYLALPAVSALYFSFNSSGFAVNDIFKKREDDSLSLDLSGLLAKLKDINSFNLDMRVPVLGFGFRAGANYFTVNIESRTSFRMDYPKSLIQFFVDGNAKEANLDKRISLDGLGIDVLSYNEFSFGMARDFNEKLTIGIRAKLLQGVAVFKTVNSQLGFTTGSDNYALTVDGSYAYQAAGLAGMANDSTAEIGDALTNMGFGADLAATYRFSEKLSVSMAINDLGLILWSGAVNNGTSNSIKYTYDGVKLNQWNLNDPVAITEVLDTIVEGINFTNDNNSFNTSLPAKLLLEGKYRLLRRTDGSLLLYNEFYNKKIRSGIRASVSQRVRNWLMATVNYSIYGGSAFNIGCGFSVNLGPLQFYTVTDNLMTFIAPLKAQNVHLRFGLNFTFNNNFSQL
jgi:hypothetical protein